MLLKNERKRTRTLSQDNFSADYVSDIPPPPPKRPPMSAKLRCHHLMAQSTIDIFNYGWTSKNDGIYNRFSFPLLKSADSLLDPQKFDILGKKLDGISLEMSYYNNSELNFALFDDEQYKFEPFIVPVTESLDLKPIFPEFNVLVVDEPPPPPPAPRREDISFIDQLEKSQHSPQRINIPYSDDEDDDFFPPPAPSPPRFRPSTPTEQGTIPPTHASALDARIHKIKALDLDIDGLEMIEYDDVQVCAMDIDSDKEELETPTADSLYSGPRSLVSDELDDPVAVSEHITEVIDSPDEIDERDEEDEEGLGIEPKSQISIFREVITEEGCVSKVLYFRKSKFRPNCGQQQVEKMRMCMDYLDACKDTGFPDVPNKCRRPNELKSSLSERIENKCRGLRKTFGVSVNTLNKKSVKRDPLLITPRLFDNNVRHMKPIPNYPFNIQKTFRPYQNAQFSRSEKLLMRFCVCWVQRPFHDNTCATAHDEFVQIIIMRQHAKYNVIKQSIQQYFTAKRSPDDHTKNFNIFKSILNKIKSSYF